MSGNSAPQPGGFIPPSGLLSPAPSSTVSSRAASKLPKPRGKALPPGSNKAELVRRYADERLLHVSRRFMTKIGNIEPGEPVVGYTSFSEVCHDLDDVLNVLWLSATPSLQIPFMLRLAGDFTEYVNKFPPSSKASFELLHKLDHCFSSLLEGRDIDSGDFLPGFENGMRAGLTTTDMVRCRSLVELTRNLMVEVLSKAPEDLDLDEGEDETETETETDATDTNDSSTRASWMVDTDDDDQLHLDAARIYENTIGRLNDRLGDPLDTRQATDDQACAKAAMEGAAELDLSSAAGGRDVD